MLWALAIAFIVFFYLRSRHSIPLPPGPRPWPLVGNALHIPKEKEWLSYTGWAKLYGQIMSLTVFGRNIIILNSARAAFDLLQERSSIYSDRPHLTFGGEMVGWDHGLSLVPYGEKFRKMRRITFQVLGPQAAKQFWPTQERETARFLARLLQSPENFLSHIRHTVGAVVLKISHGYTVSPEGNDPLVELAEKTVEEFSSATVAGAFLVDFLPWLKFVPSWVPGAGFQRTAKRWRKNLFHMADTAHNYTERQMETGTALPSFTSKLLDEAYTDDMKYLIKWTAFSIYGAGADTTVSAIATFFLAMCLHPEVQASAQAELDAVVGTDRLPTLEDRASLPYIEAVMKEVLRWGPVAPTGVPHRLIREDVYNGFRIPEGSIVIPNIWGMTHDPEIYPEPNEFRPERFVRNVDIDTDPSRVVFGFGRRKCPGMHLAEPSVFLAIAMTLATFTISKSRDKQSGVTLEPTAVWSPGIISHPVPFSCEIKPRSSRAVEVIKRSVVASGE